jgi:hypothetical protein
VFSNTRMMRERNMWGKAGKALLVAEVNVTRLEAYR